MRNFIASMIMVSGMTVIITTFNNGVQETNIGGATLKSVISENSIVINTNRPAPEDVTDIKAVRPVYNQIFQVSTQQLVKKFSDNELIAFRDVNGKVTELSRSQINALAAGVYIIRKDDKIYKYLKR